jgi:hypothetical protein
VWLALAAQCGLPQSAVGAVLLHADAQLCKQRVLERVGHKTLPAKESNLHVVDNFVRQLERPNPSEGFPEANIFAYNTRSSDGTGRAGATDNRRRDTHSSKEEHKVREAIQKRAKKRTAGATARGAAGGKQENQGGGGG